MTSQTPSFGDVSAREAAMKAVRALLIESVHTNSADIADAAIDAFLSKALEGADEKLAEIRERNKALGGHFPRNTLSTMHLWANELYADNTALLTLVTALSAEKQELAMQALSLSGELETASAKLKEAIHSGDELAVALVSTKHDLRAARNALEEERERCAKVIDALDAEYIDSTSQNDFGIGHERGYHLAMRRAAVVCRGLPSPQVKP